MTDYFLYTHLIHDVPYIEWIHMTYAEREEAAPGYRTKAPVVTKLAPIDPQIQQAAAAHANDAERYLQWAKAVEVGPANMEVVTSCLTDMKARVTMIRDFFRPALGRYTEIEEILKHKIGLASRAQLQANGNAMRAAQVAMQVGDVRGAALAANVMEDLSIPKNITIKDVWTFTITDSAKVPQMLCSPDLAKIKAFIAEHGNKYEIPGVAIAKDTSVTVTGRADTNAKKFEIAIGHEAARTESVNHPAHYGGDTKFEVIKLIEDWGLGFHAGNALKYVVRAGKKSASVHEDLSKALWYLERWALSTLIENFAETVTLDPAEAAAAHGLPEELGDAVFHIRSGAPSGAGARVRRYLRNIGLA